ncbi:MAG: hypothetical protein JO153_00755 [Solirubrobacterales bacterium]|nr:hypothetical protein [Solirubrobacterales bacterium]
MPSSEAADALRRLEERLDRASDAAQRLLAEAAERVEEPRAGEAPPAGKPPTAGEAPPAGKPPTAGEPPPAGWQAPTDGDARTWHHDLDRLLAAVALIQDAIPPDLQRRLAEAVRELLLALRAVIDWYLERAEPRRAQAAEAQDIPIA